MSESNHLDEARGTVIVDLSGETAADPAPAMLSALIGAHGPGYGTDEASQRLDSAFTALAGRSLAVYPVTGGTAANGIALSLLLPHGGTIWCHEDAHIRISEQGAPGFFVPGVKLAPLPGAHGRIDPDALRQRVATGAGVLSVSQMSERGAIYDLDHLRELASVARQAGLSIHIDGARLAMACAALGCDLATFVEASDADVVCLGGTKNGTALADAVLAFRPAPTADADAYAIRKRSGHVAAQAKLIAAQLIAYAENGRWLDLAHAANRAGERLRTALRTVPGLPTPLGEGNMTFLPGEGLDEVMAAAGIGHKVLFGMVRLVTSHATRNADIDRAVDAIRAMPGAVR